MLLFALAAAAGGGTRLTGQCQVSAPVHGWQPVSFPCRAATFGPNTWTETDVPVFVPDGAAALGCSAGLLPSDIAGSVVLLRRGQCAFNAKVANCARGGAVGVIIADSAADKRAPMLLKKAQASDKEPLVPVVSTTMAGGASISELVAAAKLYGGGAQARLSVTSRRVGLPAVSPSSHKRSRVWLMATFPHTGATWLREIWDIATGVASQSVFRLAANELWDASTSSWAFSEAAGCNPDPKMQYYNTLNATVCSWVHRALPWEDVLVKTHHPTNVSAQDGGDLRSIAKGVILTRRSADSWCRQRREQVKGAKGGLATQDECTAVISGAMEAHNRYYGSLPHIVLDFDEMRSNATAAAYQLGRLWRFTGITPKRNALLFFPPRGPRRKKANNQTGAACTAGATQLTPGGSDSRAASTLEAT
jgi:hypothetical protein